MDLQPPPKRSSTVSKPDRTKDTLKQFEDKKLFQKFMANEGRRMGGRKREALTSNANATAPQKALLHYDTTEPRRPAFPGLREDTPKMKAKTRSKDALQEDQKGCSVVSFGVSEDPVHDPE